MKEHIKRLAMDEGAAAAGVSSTDRLNPDVPSMDPTYLLPSAKSIVSVMLPLDGDIIRRYLGKQNHEGFQQHETEVYRELHRILTVIGKYLESEGHKAVAAEPNLDYRFKDKKAYKMIPPENSQKAMDWLAAESGPVKTKIKRGLVRRMYKRSTSFTDWNLTPSFSHRYGAVATGLGSFGWSSNVFNPEYGTRVLFDTLITDAPLESDPMIDETSCDGCRICTKVCQVAMMHPKQMDQVTIGGKVFTHCKKGHNLRCIMSCAGFTGQDKYQGWSTWSPGRIKLPDNDDNIVEFWDNFAKENAWQHNYYSKVLSDLTFHTEYGFLRKPHDRFMTTCGNCQIVCWKSREERQENYDILVESGEVVEGPNFSFQVKH